ncbi:hypothetical protein [Streptococcus cuniculi]|uniref:Uncharacterized protein n=1 Tax=Streptococcus cuniculi TaxID=1432788 RepID=A0A4Y9JBH9_9STRE|nr:hypothetical protein [Streptococcus cuniculi]MBF0778169.1 hypothetical protein [Streptococcus cuniculi]TFU97911.1 hypothetical protein E4T82_05450 [Streptococcus cuniculi]
MGGRGAKVGRFVEIKDHKGRAQSTYRKGKGGTAEKLNPSNGVWIPVKAPWKHVLKTAKVRGYDIRQDI